MQPSLQMARAESLGGIWSAFHRGADLVLSTDDEQYLRRLALALDDDLVSYLLLMKLRQADLVPAEALPGEAVRITSLVRFTVNAGAAEIGRILHPSPWAPPDAISIASLLGAGLIGVRKGGSILWPTEDGEFQELHVLDIEHHQPMKGTSS